METNSGYSSDKVTTEVDYSYFNNVLFSQKKDNDLISTKTKLLTQITELEMSIRSCSKLETITAVMTHVRAAINLAKAMECQTEERTLCIKRKVSRQTRILRNNLNFSPQKRSG